MKDHPLILGKMNPFGKEVRSETFFDMEAETSEEAKRENVSFLLMLVLMLQLSKHYQKLIV